MNSNKKKSSKRSKSQQNLGIKSTKAKGKAHSDARTFNHPRKDTHTSTHEK